MKTTNRHALSCIIVINCILFSMCTKTYGTQTKNVGVEFTNSCIIKNIDTDNDGFIDFISLSYPIEVTVPGTYMVVGNILTKNNKFICTGYNTTHMYTPNARAPHYVLTEQTTSINIFFDAEEIITSKRGGPYRIKIGVMGEQDSLGEYQQIAEDEFVTEAYKIRNRKLIEEYAGKKYRSKILNIILGIFLITLIIGCLWKKLRFNSKNIPSK